MAERLLHYNRVARALHWTVGTLIIVNLFLGIVHDWVPKGYPVMDIHKSIGLLVLALSLFRLLWRITHPAPPLPAHFSNVEAFAAHGLHWIFYALMIILPMTGWIFSSAGPYPLHFFWLFDVPKFAVEKGAPLAIGTHNAHVVFGYAWVALLIGHVGAALRHQFILKDDVMTRMWRSAPRP